MSKIQNSLVSPVRTESTIAAPRAAVPSAPAHVTRDTFGKDSLSALIADASKTFESIAKEIAPGLKQLFSSLEGKHPASPAANLGFETGTPVQKQPAAPAASAFAVTPIPAGTTSLGKTDPSEPMQVTLVLPRQNAAEFETKLKQAVTTHQYMTSQEIAQNYGASPADIASVQQYAAAHGLTVVSVDPGAQTVVLSGTVGQMNSSFGANMQNFESNGQTFRSPTGQLTMPPELQGKVQNVFGLDNQPLAQTQYQKVSPAPAGAAQSSAVQAGGKASAADPTSYNPNDVAKMYNFPTNSAKGQTIGLIELGGGYQQSDLNSYFQGLGMATPKVTSVGVDGATNVPGKDPNGADGEVELDNEVAGAMAPGANIADYFAPNTDAGFLDAIKAAVNDSTNKPSVLSISWGGPESSWTKQDTQAFNQEFEDAAAEGITVTAAAGDSGSGDGAKGNNVDFPGSSPYVLDVGGTSIQSSNGQITGESVWNDGTQNGTLEGGGGGVSKSFPVPTWQKGLESTTTKGKETALTGRGAPDVAFDADPETGYNVMVDGQQTVIGGTSAGAPAWAALIALADAANGKRAGDVHQALYSDPGAFNDITQGNNGAFKATKGWDAATGLGTPDGQAIVQALANASSAAA